MIDIKKKDRKNGWIDFRKSIVKKKRVKRRREREREQGLRKDG